MKLLLILLFALVTIGYSQLSIPQPQNTKKRFCGGDRYYWQNRLNEAMEDMHKEGCTKVTFELQEFGNYLVWGEATVTIE